MRWSIAKITPLGFLALFVPLMAVLLVANSAAYYAMYHADGIVLVLMSVGKWTPFYWEQDRLGAFVPLILSCVRNPFYNLVLQSLIHIGAGISSIYLLPYLITKDLTRTLVAGSLSLALMATVMHPFRLFEFLGFQPVALPLTGYLLMLLIARREEKLSPVHYALFLALALLSMWMNLSFATFTIFTFVFLLLLERRLRNLALLAIASCAAGLNGYWMSLVEHGKTAQELVEPGAILPGLAQVVGTQRMWVSLVALALAALASLPMRRQPSATSTRLAWIMALAVALNSCLLLLSSHVHANLLDFRYFLPAFVLFTAIGISLMVAFVFDLVFTKPARSTSVTLATLAACGLAFLALSAVFPQSRHGARDVLTKRFSTYTDRLLRDKIPLVVGSYWKVWPTVFHAHWRMHEEDLRLPIFGVAHRANPTRKHWMPFLEQEQRMLMFHQKGIDAIEYIQMYSQKKWRYTAVSREKDATVGTLLEPQ